MLVPSLSFFSSNDVLGVRKLSKTLEDSSSAMGGGADVSLRPRKTEAVEARVGRSGGPAGAGGGGGAAVLGT